jgi:hypothetical protein
VFIKGGIMYYFPLKESQNAFDSSMLIEKKNNNTNGQSETEVTGHVLDEFDPDFVNDRQFINLINSYIMPSILTSEIKVNDLVVHIKDNFGESQIEKDTKMAKVTFKDDF